MTVYEGSIWVDYEMQTIASKVHVVYEINGRNYVAVTYGDIIGDAFVQDGELPPSLWSETSFLANNILWG